MCDCRCVLKRSTRRYVIFQFDRTRVEMTGFSRTLFGEKCFMKDSLLKCIFILVNFYDRFYCLILVTEFAGDIFCYF